MSLYPSRIAGDVRAIYRYLRQTDQNMSAERALRWAKHEAKVDDILSRIDWTGEYRGNGHPMRVGAIDGAEIVIYADEEPYDWGDDEPSDDERASLEVIGVSVRIAGEEDPIQVKYRGKSGPDGEWRSFYADADVWGVGYLHGDMEREAVSTVIESGWLDDARTELAERSYWSARDVETVNA